MPDRLWRSYDQEGLDRQLNLRARTPEHPEIFADWAARSAEVRDARDCRADLAYGDAPAERLDFLPAGDGAAPLLAFIHGGYWQALDKSDFTYLAPAFLDAGIAYASINYTLAPDAPIPRMVAQVRAALAWLHGNADELGVDRRRLVVAGHSAGGHLAAMAASADWPGLGLPAEALAGACSVSGIYQLEPLRLSYQQPVLQLDPEAARSTSPQNAIPAAAPPLVLAVGEDEPEEFHEQQAEFQAAWRAAGHACREVELPGRHHFTAVDALGEADAELHRVVCALARDRRLP